MNESVSIFLATTILALGGLGLYMYKSSDDKEEYDEGDLFGTSRLFNWGISDETENDTNVNDININKKSDEEYDEDVKPRKRAPKTHKNRKSTGSSKRRYY